MPQARLQGRHILIAEDEFLIADDLAERLKSVGATVIGPAASVEEALALAQAEPRIDAAVLDVNLRGELAFPVADALTARNIPFIFVTGYDAAILEDRFRNCVRTDKPVSLGVLADQLCRFSGDQS